MPTGQASLSPALRRVVLAGAGVDRTDGQLLGAFVTDRDADSFGLLVRRHGPMVLGVCRRVLGDRTNAEDAFQAVFLVLARRAATVKPREQVGNWLYGVAYRTALKARAVLARRRSREKQVLVMPEPLAPAVSNTWSDLQPVIDEELARLPEKLRGPVVLCDIEGRPQREVAKQLGVPAATLATRLATARRTLAQRLTKRGVTLSGGAVAGLLTLHGTACAVPHALAQGLIRAAEAVATGSAVSALVSASAVQLSEGVMRMMLLTKLKTVAVVALTAIALTTGIGLGLVPARAADPVPGPQEKVPAAKPAEPPGAAIDKAIAARWKNARINLNEPMDDMAFLRRLTLDVRGDLPTDIEAFFFAADRDETKRAKVVTWLLDDGGMKKAYAARLLGLPVDRIHNVELVDVGGAKPRMLVIVVESQPELRYRTSRVEGLSFTADGERLAVEVNAPENAGNHVGNAKFIELMNQARATDARIQRYETTQALNVVDGAEKVAPQRGDVMVFKYPEPAQAQGYHSRVQVLAQAGDAKAKVQELYGLYFGNESQNPNVRVWDAATGKGIVDIDNDGQPSVWLDVAENMNLGESDLDFLKKATQAARGTVPTALESKYFTEDKDPKKREKLLDTLLKEPAVARKLGDDFKKKMLAAPPGMLSQKPWEYYVVPLLPKDGRFEFKIDPNQKTEPYLGRIVPTNPKWILPVDPKAEYQFELFLGDPNAPPISKTPPTAQPPATLKTPEASPTEKLEKLVGELLALKKTDIEMLEAVTLATVGRLPTDTEKKLTLSLIATAQDRKAAWVGVIRSLAGVSEGAKKVTLHFRTGPVQDLVLPVPPAKP